MLNGICKACTPAIVRRQICIYSISRRLIGTIPFQQNSSRTIALKLIKTDQKSCAQMSIFSKLSSGNKAEYGVNTSVLKDVVLYKLVTASAEYKVLASFSVCQFAFWVYLAHFAFTELRDVPVENSDKSLPFWKRINFGEKKYRYGLTALSLLIGTLVLVTSGAFSARSVYCLILHKGGTKLTFVTRNLFGTEKRFTTDLTNVSCLGSRHVSKVSMPIKVKNRLLYYILDMKGEFTNPQLFDYTAGMQRKI